MAVISLLLPSTATWPNVKLASVAQALTRCNGPHFDPAEPHNVLPSIAMWPMPKVSAIARSHPRQQHCKERGSSLLKTRSKVSCDGTPLGSFKNRLNHV